MASVTLRSVITKNDGFLDQDDLNNGYLTSQSSDIWIERSETGIADSATDQTYTLDIYGSATSGDLTSFDINLGYNTSDWNVVDVTSAKLNIDDGFKYFNSSQFNDDAGQLRVVGGSADAMSGGAGLANGADGLLFSVHFTANDVLNTTSVGQYIDTTAFTWSVNETDTIVNVGTSGTGSDFETAGLSGSSGVSYTMTELLSDIEYTTSDLSFVTDQVIGTSAKTSLVREGSTLIADGSLEYTNTGLADAFTDGGASLAETVAGVDISLVGTSDTTTEFVKTATDTTAVDALQLQMTVTGTAGDVIDYMDSSSGESLVNITRLMSNGETLTSDSTDINIGKNLVTYQADINYDGRVSMMDLATLNAGAQATGAEIGSVDVDYNGSIGISDLVQMDAQWGSSLHSLDDMTGNNKFTGNGGTIDLSSTSIGGSDIDMTDNSIFITQNATENSTGFADSLVDSGYDASAGEYSTSYHDDASQFDTTGSEIVEVM